MAWRNFLDSVTPAIRLGLAAEPWTWRRALARRLFPATAAPTPTEDPGNHHPFSQRLLSRDLNKLRTTMSGMIRDFDPLLNHWT